MLAITVKTKAGRSAEFLKHWGELAAWVRANEPDTLAYEASRVEGDPEKIFVYERWVASLIASAVCLLPYLALAASMVASASASAFSDPAYSHRCSGGAACLS